MVKEKKPSEPAWCWASLIGNYKTKIIFKVNYVLKLYLNRIPVNFSDKLLLL